MAAPRVNIDIPEDFLPLFDESLDEFYSRYLTFYGGRGGLKSWQIGRALLWRGMRKPLWIGCFRQFQNSIDDSVMSLLKQQAEIIGVSDFYNFQKKAIYGANGTEFIFRGLDRNLDSLKSLEGLDIGWIEEGQSVKKEAIEKLFPTIRKPGSQIITSFNTGDEDDPIYQRLVVNATPGKHYVRKVIYSDYLDLIPQELIDEAEAMERTDPEAFANVFLGEPWTRSDSQVLADKWRVDYMDPDIETDSPLWGADFGFSVDPSTLIKVWIMEREGRRILYIEREAYENGVEVDDYPRFYGKIPESKKFKIRADNARPELISHIRKKGFNITACKKWSGSVEDGISTLRSFDEIVIDPSCKHTIEEARLWRYKTDRKTGDVLPVLVDANNHCFDAIRYALEPIIKQTKDISIRVA